jgi:MSHA biogenesis protein MshJ
VNGERWQALQVWFGLRPARERLILMLAIGVVLGYAWLLLGLDTLTARAADAERQLLQIQRENAALSNAHAALKNSAEEEPNSALQRQIARLEAQNARLDVEVGAMSVTLVEPERMAMVLSRVMAKQPNIELIGMQNRSAEQLFFRAVDSGEPLVVFKHGLRLELKGGYLDALEYLADIEALGVRFFWESVTYEAEEYPAGILTIDVFTLSTQEQLINV